LILFPTLIGEFACELKPRPPRLQQSVSSPTRCHPEPQ
jgi:hypothetical protein